MTAVLEEEERVDTDPPVAAEAPRRGGWARWRADLRLARRQVWRAKGASALIVLLVSLPMALLSAGAVYGTSRVPTQNETLTAELGQSDAWIQVIGGYDPSRTQALDDPWWWEVDRDADGVPVNPELPPPTDGPAQFLPNGTRVREVTESHLRVQTRAGVADLTAYAGDAGDPALAGRFQLLDGRAPSTGELALSPGALDRLHAEVGDTVRLADSGDEYTVSGVLKRAEDADGRIALFLPPGAAVADGPTTWFVEEWAPAAADVTTLNQQGYIVYSRTLIERLGSTGTAAMDPGSQWYLIALLSAVGLFCGYLVVLLAGAAFSVGARRQQRSLAVAASVGADRKDLFRIVLLQGTVLGAVGGVLGAAAGIGLGAVALPLFGDGSVATFWGLHVPWPLLVGIVVFAATVGTASALFPARAATRGDTLAALRGARKPVAVRVSRPLWGWLLIAVGVGATVLSGITLAALNTAEVVDYNSPIRTVCLYGVIGGPILFQVGVLLGGHWLLSVIQRAISHLGLAPRLAGRDAAANPGRIVPAFGAIAACTFLASVALASVGVTNAAGERGWQYQAPLGSAYVTLYSDGASDADAAALVDAAYDTIDATAPVLTAEVLSQPYPFAADGSPTGALVVSARMQQYVDCDVEPAGDCHSAYGALIDGFSRLAVIDPDDLAVVLGADPGHDVLATLRAGGALVTSTSWLADGEVELNVFTGDDLPGGMFGGGTPQPERTELVPGTLLDLPHRIPFDVVISPQLADDLGVTVRPSTIIATYTGPAQPDVLDRIQATLSNVRTGTGGFGWGIESGPPEAAPWLWLILGATAVLVVGASAVALGLARVERRPDDATLTAVGAGSALRRGVAFWQALIVTGLGGVTGAIAGLLPVWGVVLMTQNVYSPPRLDDTPWLWLGILALALPLAIAVVSWLVPPRHPDLTRRTAIA